MKKIIIGVDGGGTKTKLAAADNTGNILGYCSCGSINYNYSDIEQCRNNLKDGIDILLKSLNLSDYDYLSIGHCSLDGEATEDEKFFFCGNVFVPEKTILHSDAYMALIGAAPLSPGVMVISGTGTMCVARDKNNKTLIAGGWGYILGDEGSCYYIAWRGIISAVHHFEGRGKRTAITEKLIDYYKIKDKNMRGIINRLYTPEVEISRIAGFAEFVIECARNGDKIAGKIISDAIDILVKTASGLIEKLKLKDGVMGIYGGLFEHNPDIASRFCSKIQNIYPEFKIGFPEFEPELGAIIYYFIQNGSLSEDIINRIRETKNVKKICERSKKLNESL